MHYLIIVALLLAAPAWAQVPDGSATVQAVAREGYFARCEAGERRGCALFARLVALRLNPDGREDGWGWLTKGPGETGHDGYAEDAIVWTADPTNLRNVVDIVGGAGAPGARPGWGSAVTRRASNRWARPVPLSAEDLAYLGGNTPTPAPPPPSPTPEPGPDHQALMTRIGALEGEIRALRATLGEFAPVVLATAANAERAADAATIAAHDAKVGADAVLVIKDWLAQGLALRLNARFIGAVSGTVTAPQ